MSKRGLLGLCAALVMVSVLDSGCSRPRIPGLPGAGNAPAAPPAPPAAPPPAQAAPNPGQVGGQPAPAPSGVAGLPPGVTIPPGVNIPPGVIPAGGGLPQIPQIPAGIPPGFTGLPPGVTPPAPAPAGPVDVNLTVGQPTVDGALGAEMDKAVADWAAARGGYSGSVLVARDGRVLLNKGYGVADAERNIPVSHNALWDWASVGKQFTSAAVLKARMAGNLALEDPVTKWYPGDKGAVQIWHLLSHTTGIQQGVPDLMGTLGRDEFAGQYLGRAQLAPPGTKYEYNPVGGYNVAAAIVEKATGVGFEDYVTRNVFRPAGMNEAYFIGNPAIDQNRVPKSNKGTGPRFVGNGFYTWQYRGSGGVVTTARGLLAWDQALRGESVLDAAAKAELYRVRLDNYALGWQVGTSGTDTTYSHAGNNGNGTFRYKRTLNSKVCVAFACSHQIDVGSLIDDLIRIAERPSI